MTLAQAKGLKRGQVIYTPEKLGRFGVVVKVLHEVSESGDLEIHACWGGSWEEAQRKFSLASSQSSPSAGLVRLLMGNYILKARIISSKLQAALLE